MAARFVRKYQELLLQEINFQTGSVLDLLIFDAEKEGNLRKFITPHVI